MEQTSMTFPLRMWSLALAVSGLGIIGALGACSSDGSHSLADAGGLDASASTDGGGDAGRDAGGDGDASVGDGGGAACPSEYADGYFDAPTNTFTLPASAISSAHEIYLPDIQASFPAVDWTTLDRFYIPAGHYALLNIGNLPQRTAARPLVITNLGGQVTIGGLGASYTVVLKGGGHWSLTGRYDPVAKTGDAAFPGHRCANYGASRDHYGITVDDGWHEFPDQQMVGISIGASAHDFELEFIEIHNIGFAAIFAKNHDASFPIMHHMRFHDLYIHDVGSEGFYVGDTDIMNPVPYDHVSIYNNRVLRTGSEAVQVGQLGDGSEIRNNVFALGGRMWRAAFECTVQDGNAQYAQRNGVATVNHNVFLGATQSLMQTFQQVVTGDPHAASDGVTIDDNYFASTGWLGVYAHFPASPVAFTTTFQHNFFRDLSFSYGELYPNLTERTWIFGGSSVPNEPFKLIGNLYDTPWALDNWGGDANNPDGTFGNLVVSGSVRKTLPAIQFVDFGLASDTDYRHVEFWVPKNGCYNQWSSGQADPAAAAPIYQKGTIVVYKEQMYRLDVATSQGEVPDATPQAWTPLGLPKDDVRQLANIDYPGIGLAY
ncbi:MAG: right-handed parallel beta-helix repeat-containing protein [Polyangia bacterium]